jgi:SAM-dependent methyltransferase
MIEATNEGRAAMRLYDDLASWWPLLSEPGDYAEEAELFRRVLSEGAGPSPRTVLELGSGGGNNASHLKRHFSMTLTDVSAGMLEASRALNPECEHVQGDMRSLRLHRTFDAVFVHDAICYMTTEADLRSVLETAWVHCRSGGVALFVPDHVRETFRDGTSCGGHDGEGRSLRYLGWSWDPDPADTTYIVDYVYLLREGAGVPRVVPDRHIEGLFPRDLWLSLLAAVGFMPERVAFDHSELESGTWEGFIGRRP